MMSQVLSSSRLRSFYISPPRQNRVVSDGGLMLALSLEFEFKLYTRESNSTNRRRQSVALNCWEHSDIIEYT